MAQEESPTRLLFAYVGDTLGGSHISSLTLLEELKKMPGYDPCVAIAQEGPLSAFLTRKAIDFTRFPEPVGGLHYSLKTGLLPALLSAPRLARWLRAEKIDIVHTQDFRMHVLWAVACRFAGIKHILHLRSPQKASVPFTLLALLSSRLLVVSFYGRDLLSSFLARRTTVVPNPIQAPLSSRRTARESILKNYNLAESDFLVGWAGHFSERKRPEDFAGLIVSLWNENLRNVKFIMFGDNATELGWQVREMLSDPLQKGSVCLAGWVDNYPTLVAGLDLIVSTSESESNPRNLVEALISQTPVLASDIGPNKEVVADGLFGELFRLGDIEELRKKTLRLIAGDSQATAKTLEASVYLRNRHDPQQHAELVASIYLHELRSKTRQKEE